MATDLLEAFGGRFGRFLDYWRACRGDRVAPRRADVDPLDIPDLLPFLSLIEVLREPLRFRYRVIGTAVVEGFGRDATGRYIDESLYGGEAAAIASTHARLVAEVRPFHRRARMHYTGKGWQVLDALEVPLVDDGGRVTHIFGCNGFSMSSHDPGAGRTHEPLSCPGPDASSGRTDGPGPR